MKLFLAASLLFASATSATSATSTESPWNGSWVLDASRSTLGVKDQAADAYRFTLQPAGQIKWEIPSLGEVVTGKADGVPMEIHRTRPSPGLTLSVTAEGPAVLIYKVARNGQPEGEGRMTLVENGKAWVDISWPAGQPQYAGELVYAKQ
jgi:hypothetical protein